MRFRKRVKVFPGFYLNFSNSGVSSTFGVKGASINFSKKGTYLNSGIPGTGLYSRQKIQGGKNYSISDSTHTIPIAEETMNQSQILVGEIKSAETDKLTSASLVELKETLEEVYNDRIELARKLSKRKKRSNQPRLHEQSPVFFSLDFS
ncbi:MAG: DUF4236 domain-containing protein [Crocinitomicaceae bacterium]|nr:DUF4236 domain-containing protein [Crocinitomicaceae bacterium]